MKKTALFTALIAAAGVVTTTAQAAPTVYGKVDASLQTKMQKSSKDNSYTTLSLTSNAARVGVKGDVAIDDGIKGIYKIELNGDIVGVETKADSSIPPQAGADIKDGISVGTRYIGIDANFGEIKLGVFDTPMKEAKKDVDLANNVGGFESLNEVKARKFIQYTSPSLSGVKFALGLAPRSKIDEVKKGAGDYQANNGSMRISTAVSFEQDGIYAAVAFDTGVSDGYAEKRGSKASTGIRAVAQLNMVENLQLGVMYDTNKNGDSKETQTNILASVSYAVGSITPRLQFSNTAYKTAKDKKSMRILAGVNFDLAENVLAYTDVAHSTSNSGAAGAKDKPETAIDLGLQYKF